MHAAALHLLYSSFIQVSLGNSGLLSRVAVRKRLKTTALGCSLQRAINLSITKTQRES